VSLEQAKVLGWLWEITPKYEALPLSWKGDGQAAVVSGVQDWGAEL
jgi:hypothetical protein